MGLIISSMIFLFISQESKKAIIQWWCGGLLRAFGIRVIATGHLPPHNSRGLMLVANHVSWADIHALNSQIALRFIAKAEIRKWPVFGYLAYKARVLFIDRTKKQLAGSIVQIAAESLMQGDNLCVFPEGTTTDGTHILPFKGSVLQAAITANAMVWPVAIRYANLDGSINTKMAYAGETSLVESIAQIIKLKNAQIELHFLTPICAKHQDRRDLTQQAYNAITAYLGLQPHPVHHAELAL